MKRSFLSLLLVLWLLGSCNNDDKAPNSAVDRVRSIMNDGTWYITYFVDSDMEETANFVDFTFDFSGDNTITATKSQTVNTGTWSVKQDDGDDSDDLSDVDFNIYFSAPAELQDLTDDWEILSLSDTRLELRHESGGGGTDFLTFEKTGS